MVKIKKIDLNPLSINILKLQRYNFNYFTLEEVVFFEYLVVKGKSFKFKPFYHSTATIAQETGIKRTRLTTIIRKFEEAGFIRVEVKGMPKVKHFTVDYEKISSSLDLIYRNVQTNQTNVEWSKLLADFYQPLAASYLQKNTNKNINKELLKEIIVSDNGLAMASQRLSLYLEALMMIHPLKPEQTSFDMQTLELLLSLYSIEDIMAHTNMYYTKHSKEGTFEGLTNDLIKKHERQAAAERNLLLKDSKQAKDFIEELNSIFNVRRDLAGSSEKRYLKSRLAVNESAINKVVIALQSKDKLEIKNAFTAYIDAILRGDENPKRIVNYFFTQKDGEFPIIDNYLDYYNSNYSIR